MQLLNHVTADDRIILLSIPELSLISRLANIATSVVCLGERDVVYEARKAARDLRNVMFHPGDPADIPFNDGAFTKVIVLQAAPHAASEVARVLAGGGLAYIPPEDSDACQEAGLIPEPDSGDLAVFCKPDDPPREGQSLEFPVLR